MTPAAVAAPGVVNLTGVGKAERVQASEAKAENQAAAAYAAPLPDPSTVFTPTTGPVPADSPEAVQARTDEAREKLRQMKAASGIQDGSAPQAPPQAQQTPPPPPGYPEGDQVPF